MMTFSIFFNLTHSTTRKILNFSRKYTCTVCLVSPVISASLSLVGISGYWQVLYTFSSSSTWWSEKELRCRRLKNLVASPCGSSANIKYNYNNYYYNGITLIDSFNKILHKKYCIGYFSHEPYTYIFERKIDL